MNKPVFFLTRNLKILAYKRLYVVSIVEQLVVDEENDAVLDHEKNVVRIYFMIKTLGKYFLFCIYFTFDRMRNVVQSISFTEKKVKINLPA
jgi:hypothetical protein